MSGPLPGRQERVIQGLSARVRHLDTAGAGMALAELLAVAAQLHGDADCLAAAAVDTARREGRGWAEIGAEAGMAPAAARSRWGGLRTERLLSDDVPAGLADAISGARTPVRPAPAMSREAAARRTGGKGCQGS
ncbi:hypothetical protein AB0G74_08800 [Streptomyces sp. NPDC020875]|uniref:hypothetical protein n=1 Tax=Streptomyces sp. NPDC020875 TaxID=3154898 RepID=UPI0033E491F7